MSGERRQLNHWLADTLRHEREAADMPVEHIAVAMGVSVRTVTRLENPDELGPSGAKPWGRDIDRAVAAYAHLLGLDPRDLWRMALDRWQNTQPTLDLTDDLPGGRYVEAIREAALARRDRTSTRGEEKR